MWNIIIAVITFGLIVLWPKKLTNQNNTTTKIAPEHAEQPESRLICEDSVHQAAERLYWKRQNKINYVGLVFNIATFVGAVVGVCIAYNAFQESRRSANEAHRQADAAESQIGIAKDTAVRQLRAYVVVSSKELERFDEGQIGRVQGILENLGQTPVYEAVWVSGINVFPPAGAFTYPECKDIMRDSKKWFFGKFSYPDKDRATVFTADETSRVKSGQAGVYFNGRVCYRDIFKEIRRTDFCIRWAWQNGSLGTATYCDQGNEAD